VAISQIERVPAYQALADHLRAQITSGALRPGDRLPTEPQLCAQSGVSRSTVREALRLLASQNLIVTTRGVTGGSFVVQPSAEQLGDMLSTGLRMLMDSGRVTGKQWFEVRETFEVPAARLAALRRTDEHIATLEKTLFDPDTSPPEVIAAADLAFHVRVAEATGNPLYELIIQPLYAMANKRVVGEKAPDGFWQRVDAEHRALLRAIAAGDPEAAEAAARAHLRQVRDSYAEVEVCLDLG
jgi:GntR family transcriptional repressor for pyruvate dehydrogenase complex